MKKTFLFDLDGTLLPMDFHKFMKLYFGSMGHTFQDVMNPETMIQYIDDASKVTVMTNDGRTNEDIFMESFNEMIDVDVNEYIPRWDAYYDKEFFACKDATWQNEDIKEAIQILKNKGYRLAIATNPLLPLKSNLHRVAWAGLNIDDFDYISSFEENKHCKPFLEFYGEVCEKLSVSPKDCIMVGNDVSEDLVSRHLGMETYLITDCKLNRKDVDYETDHEGTYKEFLSFVKNL